MKKRVRLTVTDNEKNIIIRSLIDLRNTLICEGRYTDPVDELLLKLMD